MHNLNSYLYCLKDIYRVNYYWIYYGYVFRSIKI